MNIKVKGVLRHDFEIDVNECLDVISYKLGFGKDYLVEDNKLFERVDVGTHKSDYEKIFRSDNKEKVELFKAIKLLSNYFKSL